MSQTPSRERFPLSLRVLMYQFFPGGGIGRYTHELCTALAARGDVCPEVVCSTDYEFNQDPQYRVWPGLAPLSSRNVLVRRSRFLLGQLRNPRRLLQHAAQSGADVIHFANINHLTFPFWRTRLARSGCVIAATAHDVRRAQTIVNRRWEDAGLRGFYQHCDALFVHSESQREDLQAFAGIPEDRIHLVPHGPYPYPVSTAPPDDLRARYGVPRNRDVALAFGSVRDDKNLDNLLAAISDLPDPPFVIIAGRTGGKGHRGGDWYRSRIAELRLEPHVLFMDRHMTDGEVGELFRLSDVALLTYRSNFTSQSGVLNVATYFGLPAIVTSAPTMAETVLQYRVGVVCEDDQPKAIRQGIQSWRATRDQYSPAAFAACQRENSWERNAEITANVYRTLLAMRNRERSRPESESASCR